MVYKIINRQGRPKPKKDTSWWTPERRAIQAERCREMIKTRTYDKEKLQLTNGIARMKDGAASLDENIRAIGELNRVIRYALNALETMEDTANKNPRYKFLLEETDFCCLVKQLRDEIEESDAGGTTRTE